MKKKLLLIFSKYPIEGEVKTRLGACIGMDEAANFSKNLLLDLVDNHINRDYDIAIETNQKEYLTSFKKLVPGVLIKARMGNFLRGSKSMTFKILRNQFKYYSRIIAINSDVPLLDDFLIKKAFKVLDSCDVVLGPDLDGGYYLIGMKKPYDIFSNVPQERGPYLKWTIKLINKLQLKFQLIDPKVDIDYMEDLQKIDWQGSQRNWPRTFKLIANFVKQKQLD